MRLRFAALLAGLRHSAPIDRRAAVGALTALLPATLFPDRAGAAPDAERCLSLGARCGRKRQPGCGRCCSGFAKSPKGRPQRRCSCRPDLRRCRRSDECCSGLCRAMPCAGLDKPVCIPGFLEAAACDA